MCSLLALILAHLPPAGAGDWLWKVLGAFRSATNKWENQRCRSGACLHSPIEFSVARYVSQPTIFFSISMDPLLASGVCHTAPPPPNRHIFIYTVYFILSLIFVYAFICQQNITRLAGFAREKRWERSERQRSGLCGCSILPIDTTISHWGREQSEDLVYRQVPLGPESVSWLFGIISLPFQRPNIAKRSIGRNTVQRS